MVSDSFCQFVLDQLKGVRAVRAKRMFGGYGIYQGVLFFGIVFRDRVYFRTDDKTRGPYIEAGMGPFRPNARQTLKSYYEVPEAIVENKTDLAAWAAGAINADRKPPRQRKASR